MTASITNPLKTNPIPEIVRKPILTSWTITMVITLTSTIYYFLSQPQLPIFYSLADKNDQLAQKEFIFLFPAISFLMNFSHLLVIRVLKEYSSLMLRLFVITTTIFQLIFLFALLRIVLITT